MTSGADRHRVQLAAPHYYYYYYYYLKKGVVTVCDAVGGTDAHPCARPHLP